MAKDIQVLVVEDDQGDFDLLKGILYLEESNEFNLIHANSLSVAFKKLDETVYDIILLDLALPDSVGLETVTKINNKRPKIPLIAMTGLDDKEIGLATVQKGAQDFLIKGQITYDYLCRAIKYALERSRLENFRDEVVNNISHELRTPLTIIRESISQVVDGIFGSINDKQDKYLQQSLNNIDRLRGIIDNLLDISKIEAGKMELFKEKVDIKVLIDEIVSDFTLKAKVKNLEIKYFIPSEKAEFLGDPYKIIQVLMNLISNALKFTERGGIEISVQNGEREIVCAVKDTGKGIPAKDLSRVFGKFDQIGRQAGPGEKGTGLGLAISKGIVELHGGRIWVESEEGRGSKFIFSLPKYQANGVLSENLKDCLNKAIAEFNEFTVIRLGIRDQQELMAKLGEQKFGNVLSELQKFIVQNLYRKSDQVISSSIALYVLLPNTDNENSLAVAERLVESMMKVNINDLAARKFKLSFETALISYPRNGLTQEELIYNLESK